LSVATTLLSICGTGILPVLLQQKQAFRPLVDISNAQIRQVLEKTRQLSRIYGVNNTLEAKKIQDFENLMTVQV